MKKQLKRQQYITKQTAYYVATFALGGIVFVAITWFLGNYRLQSPVIFQSPIVSRYISPLPDSKTAKPVVLPLNGSEDKAKVEGVKASPSPTPHCKNSVYGPCLEEITPTPKKRTFIPQVEAAEIAYPYEKVTHLMDSEARANMPLIESRLGKAGAQLVYKESGFHNTSVNSSSGACGLFQAYPCEKMGCSLDDVSCQLEWGAKYIQNRYGTPEKALEFHRANGWY